MYIVGSVWIHGKIKERKDRERKWLDTVVFHRLAALQKDEEIKFWRGTHAQKLSAGPRTETCKMHQLHEKMSKIALM